MPWVPLETARHFYCEPVTASSYQQWHIRPEGERGRRDSGGADTKALCGREVAWDVGTLEVEREEFNRLHEARALCHECARTWSTERAALLKTLIPRASKVRIPKGTKVRSFYPAHNGDYVYGRTGAVKVHYVDEFSEEVVWPGTGGYWMHAKISDILVPR